MTSERIQRQVERLLDEADEAAARRDWQTVKDRAEHVLTFDPQNVDAVALLGAANRGLASDAPPQAVPAARSATTAAPAQPASFANGRYVVKRFLGEGGKKRVYLAHDSLLDRDVAFALIKTEGLDDAARERITREAQAMGRLGAHPHIVTVFDIGEEPLQSPGVETPGMARQAQPYLVLPVLAGGDVEGVIEKALEHKLPLELAIRIAVETCQGLEFVHGKGIVHRDLKPGNVWLTEDGRAMIGDFGLAVAMDRTRLTQAGMMVGTVSYMPPEQAMGGEITPRSDLYALGAMLYEMVCGRPPFVGDESVAIIGQHLNTPPVAPAWHRPDCPPALEALILRLLEKNPNRRPESALEVRQALQAIGQAGGQPSVGATLAVAPGDGAGASPAPTSQADPLYRRTFVGRENEVKQLHQAFDGAMSGNGALVMVVGEPGIGKTALCEQLATYVALRGGKALVGHCYEEGSLSLPYLAFVEAMRSYVLARDPDGLRSDLGTGAADVARIVSEVRDRVQGVELRPAGDPEDDRWRLLQAITSFLRNAATVQPLAIVLEDLHWADRGTLDLLLHVARNLQGARLLIVGTYRDVEVDRAHPLSGVLADLRRQGDFVRVPLRGLTVDEVHRMYAAIRGQEVSWAQAEAVHRQTEGNPLFIQEVLRYLVEEGIVVRQDGRWTRADGGEPGAGVPEGLRDVVGKRLSRLSQSASQVLSLASVMGREFRLDVLERISGLTEDDLFSALEEAQERAIIEQRHVAGTVAFRFTHAFFRTLLYEEIFAPRRIRLHQQVGQVLEEVYVRRLDEHAAELAEHFSQSTESADLGKCVRYNEQAARRALSVFAYSEAVRHLEQALRAQDILDADGGEKRFELLVLLEEILPLAGNPDRALEVAREALTIAEVYQEQGRAARVCDLALRAFMWGTGPHDVARPEWVALAEKYIAVDSEQHFRVAFTKALIRRTEGRAMETWQLFNEGFLLAEKLGNTEGILICGSALLTGAETPIGEYPSLIELADNLKGRDFQAQKARDVCIYLFSLGSVFMSWARREAAEDFFEDLARLSNTTRDPQVQTWALSAEALLSTMDGNLDGTLEIGSQIRDVLVRAGLHDSADGIRGRATRRALVYLGRYSDALDSLPANPPLLLVGGVMASQRAYCFSHLGRHEEARAILNQFLEYLEGPSGHLSAVAHRYLLEAAAEARDLHACDVLLQRVAPLAPYLVTEAGMCFCIARHLGDAATVLQRHELARSYYQQAVDLCQAVRFRPELTLSRAHLAELLLEHYPDERDAAIEHLDFAIAELRDMKMQPALERALRHRGLLKA